MSIVSINIPQIRGTSLAVLATVRNATSGKPIAGTVGGLT